MIESQQNLWEKAASALLPLSQNNNFPNILLFLFLLVLPFQLGKHFWPNVAFVAGQRVDYLSPTLYLSDVVVIVLFLLTLLSFPRPSVLSSGLKERRESILRQAQGTSRSRIKSEMTKKSVALFLAVLLYISLNIFFSASPFNGWYMLLKLLELSFVVWYIGRQGKQLFSLLVWSFAIDISIEGVLGILQFLDQGSIGGLWYFLGERTFSASTPGIANASIHGQLILRPYATFPHPNAFAGYLVIALLFLLQFLFIKNTRWKKILTGAVLIFGLIALSLTLSRVAITAFILLVLLFLVLKFSKCRSWILFGICILIFGVFLLSPLLSGRFFDMSGYGESLSLRDLLIHAAMKMFLSHPFFGVGLGNFLPTLPYFISPKILFGFLQPVHNIFLLVLAETGIVGFCIFVGVLVVAFAKSLKKLKANSPYSFSFFALLAIVFIGMTDHYFLTLQQGQLLFALILGLSFSKLENRQSHK